MNSQLVSTILYMALIVGVFYFLWFRPQQNQRKKMREMLDHLNPGDRVMTAGGLIGTLRTMDGDTIRVEIAEGVVVEFTKRAIIERLGEPVAPSDANPE